MTTERGSIVARVVQATFAHPGVVLIAALGAALYGAVSFEELPRDVFPDLSAPVFNVIVQHSAMSAEELETAIAVPLETESPPRPVIRVA